MSDGNIRLRFVTANDAISDAIRFQAGISMPFVPSHVECVSLDGKFWIGQHAKGGMMARPAGYDAGTLLTLADGSISQKFVDLPCTLDQQNCFYDHVNARVAAHAPYDIRSIANFVDPALNLHVVGELICSAEIGWALRTLPHPYFDWPTTMPFHRWSPDMLFLILSTHVEISHTGEPANG